MELLLETRLLQELRLGSAGNQPTSNKYTVEGFELVMEALGKMPELAVLEMQLPAEESLNIGK